jgi:transcriptional regulator with AAA-type ATPase domain
VVTAVCHTQPKFIAELRKIPCRWGIMAAYRNKTGELVKLFHASPRPIYLLDGVRRIVFCNQALLSWVGCAGGDLEGRLSNYHTDTDAAGLDALAAGLAPPPATPGSELTAIVACPGPDGRLRRRRARFVPLAAEAEHPSALMALVDAADLPETEPAPPAGAEPDAAWLHERIRVFHRRAAARLGIDRLLGDSLLMRRVRTQVATAAASAASVWIAGPPGSGRQRTAEAIHYGAEGPIGSLIPLDCAVLSGELVISTVQALSARRPSAERPAGSTLLLVDVDLLPSDVQTSLAQALCGRAFALRLIATARQPPEELLKPGKFRQDLGLALSTISIHLPPLTERREDLPLVAQLFLEEVNARGEKQVAGFTPEALDAFHAYPWPGNLDELAAMVALAHQRAGGPQIAVADLPDEIHLAAAAEARPRKPEETIVLDEFLAGVQRELIGRALRRAKGNKTRAARLLGMTRPRLYRRMVQLGLEEEGER